MHRCQNLFDQKIKMLSRDMLWFCISLLAILYRIAMMPNSHSGYQVPPKYGDFEAQRHWLEITYNLPMREWYHNTSNNPLDYWGLDYPPLTAYHSWLTSLFAPKRVVQLFDSMGEESLETRLFMRMTVLFWDAVMFTLPMVLMARHLSIFRSGAAKLDTVTIGWSLLYALLQPSIVLIDHGHFQYNSVAIGFTIWSIFCFLVAEEQENRSDSTLFNRNMFLYLIGSALFCCSLNFKQMSLYYSLPFFCYLSGKCVQRAKHLESAFSGIIMFICIGITVFACFLCIWLPFLTRDQLPQVLRRIFPVQRGLFEDKVANIWCSLSLIYKIHLHFNTETILKISALLTFLNSLPSCISVLLRPTLIQLAYSLVNVSCAFFLWSYHVHEKTIIFVTVPASILLILLQAHSSEGKDLNAEEYQIIHHWFILIATFSMYPLLSRDGLCVPYLASMIAYFLLAFANVFDAGNFLLYASKSRDHIHRNGIRQVILKYMIFFSFLGVIAIHFVMMLLPIPARYPDLYVFMCTTYSCLHFFAFMIYCNYKQLDSIKNSV
jgi:alpha-1,3-glucosyltransferase